MEFKNYIDYYISPIQKSFYPPLRSFSNSHPYLGRALLISATLFDSAIEMIKTPLETIQEVALAVISLVGTLFCCCSCRNVLRHTVAFLQAGIATFIVPSIHVAVFCYQIVRIIKDPQKGKSIQDAGVDMAEGMLQYANEQIRAARVQPA